MGSMVTLMISPPRQATPGVSGQPWIHRYFRQSPPARLGSRPVLQGSQEPGRRSSGWGVAEPDRHDQLREHRSVITNSCKDRRREWVTGSLFERCALRKLTATAGRCGYGRFRRKSTGGRGGLLCCRRWWRCGTVLGYITPRRTTLYSCGP
jgi:hypothetical protein